MLLHNSSEWSKTKPLWQGLLVSVLLTSAATLIRIVIHEQVQPSLPFQLFYLSIVISTFYFGWMSGLFSTSLSIMSGFYFFIQPYDSFELPSTSDIYLIAVNLVTMLVCVFIIEYLQRLIYTSSVLLKASKNNYKLYIRSENSLLNFKTEIIEHKKLVGMLTSKEEIPLVWSDPYEVITYFEKMNDLFPDISLTKSQSKLIDFFAEDQNSMILSHIHTCINSNIVVEFQFNWSAVSMNKSDFMGRFTPINIEDKKSLVFSLLKN